jgi:beta-galactosidase
MELLTPTTAQVLARYEHPAWGSYAALTRNRHGAGEVTYMGFMPSDALAERILEDAVRRAGLWGAQQQLRYPTVARSGVSGNGRPVHYLLNYSAREVAVANPFGAGTDLLSGRPVAQGGLVALPPWGVAIVEEQPAGK